MIALTIIIFIAKSSISIELGADHLEILQPLRDCLSQSIYHDPVHHDNCFAMVQNSMSSEISALAGQNHEGRMAASRFKRSIPVVERSFLQKHETEKQMCALPCQRQPLLVDQKKIFEFLGFHWMLKTLKENEMIDIGRCYGNCRAHEKQTFRGFTKQRSCNVAQYGSLWINFLTKRGNQLKKKIIEVKGLTVGHCVCANTQFCE